MSKMKLQNTAHLQSIQDFDFTLSATLSGKSLSPLQFIMNSLQLV